MLSEKELTKSVTSAIDPAALTDQRGTTHGDYRNTARYIQQFKRVMHGALVERHKRGQPPLTPDQQESLEMILHKAGRILSGDASFADHWLDISGYAHLPIKEGEK